jgi:hypothetical protein
MKVQIALGCLLAGGAIGLSSCATTSSTKEFRTFFVPPAPPGTPAPVTIDPPNVTLAYANETPNLPTSLPSVVRPSDVDFLIKKADDRFAAGKRAFQEGRTDDARKEFDRAVEVLLTAPDHLTDRARLERHMDELIESISLAPRSRTRKRASRSRPSTTSCR